MSEITANARLYRSLDDMEGVDGTVTFNTVTGAMSLSERAMFAAVEGQDSFQQAVQEFYDFVEFFPDSEEQLTLVYSGTEAIGYLRMDVERMIESPANMGIAVMADLMEQMSFVAWSSFTLEPTAPEVRSNGAPCAIGLRHQELEDAVSTLGDRLSALEDEDLVTNEDLSDALEPLESDIETLGETVGGKQDALTLGSGLKWNQGDLAIDASVVQGVLTAGTNITISAQNEISAAGGTATIDKANSGVVDETAHVTKVELGREVAVSDATTISGTVKLYTPASADHRIKRTSSSLRGDDGNTLTITTRWIDFGRRDTVSTGEAVLPSSGIAAFGVTVPITIEMACSDYAAAGTAEMQLPVMRIMLAWADTVDGASGFWLLKGSLISMRGDGNYQSKIIFNQGIFAGDVYFLTSDTPPASASTSGSNSATFYGHLDSDTHASAYGMDFGAISF